MSKDTKDNGAKLSPFAVCLPKAGFSSRRLMVWYDFSFSINQTNKTQSLRPLRLCGEIL